VPAALRRLLPALLALVLLAAGTAVAAPAPATIGGVVASGTTALPVGAKDGRAQVLALNPETGAYGGADAVDRRGAYRLRVPAGRWALLTTVFTLGDPVRQFLSASVTVRAGETRTLPVTLKSFKQPRKAKHKKKAKKKAKAKKPRARAANVNPRDGRSYPGEALGILAFAENVRDPELRGFGKALQGMLTADLFSTETRCPLTIVEMAHRAEILQELARQQTEWFDPDSRVEPGHVIDPDILLRGAVREQATVPRSLRVTAYLEDARTGKRIPGEVSAVTTTSGWPGLTVVLAERLMRDLLCPRQAAQAAAPAPAAAPPAGPATTTPPPAPPAPPAPLPLSDRYAGTFSGTAEGIGASLRFSWTGTVTLDAVQDAAVGPLGAPDGKYRTYAVSGGTAQLHVEGGDASCGFSGDATLPLIAGFGTGAVVVQTGVPSPAYQLVIGWDGMQTISASRSGTDPECTGVAMFPVNGLAWARTVTFQTSPTTTLDSNETDSSTGYLLATRWSLAPG
jgi:hypothetical protein